MLDPRRILLVLLVLLLPGGVLLLPLLVAEIRKMRAEKAETDAGSRHLLARRGPDAPGSDVPRSVAPPPTAATA